MTLCAHPFHRDEKWESISKEMPGTRKVGCGFGMRDYGKVALLANTELKGGGEA